jgi:Zn-dependent alcohol dehydrogenase
MVGSFAEYTVVDQSQVTPLAADIPFDRAALLGCGVITGFGSVVWRAKVSAMNSVVVIGTGGVGLNAIQGAAYAGAYPVIAVDILDSKLEAAKNFGATHTVNSKQVDPIAAVKELTGGRGSDYAFVTVGSMAAVQQGYKMLGSRGTTVMVGLPKPTDGLSLNCSPLEFIRTEKVIMGSYMGSVNPDVHIPQLVDLYKAGKLKLDELVSGHFPIERINEAIESVENGQALRNVIMF